MPEHFIPVQIGGQLRTGVGGLLFTSKIQHYYWLYFLNRILFYCIYVRHRNRSQQTVKFGAEKVGPRCRTSQKSKRVYFQKDNEPEQKARQSRLSKYLTIKTKL